MYRLYDYDVHSLIDQSEDEYDLIDTMSTYFQAQTGTRFLIKHTNEETKTDEIVASIKNVRDYYGYVTEKRDKKLKSMSCMQLKKEILDLQEKPKVKKLGSMKK